MEDKLKIEQAIEILQNAICNIKATCREHILLQKALTLLVQKATESIKKS